MLSILNTKCRHKHNCESTVHVHDHEKVIMGCISDGIKEGTRPHFASQLVNQAIVANLMIPSISNDMIKEIMIDLAKVSDILLVHRDDLLANCIMFLYDKETKTLRVRSFGDSYYIINEDEHLYNSTTPIQEQMAYHLFDDREDIEVYLNNRPEKVYNNVDRFIISSNSITTINRPEDRGEAKFNSNILLYPPNFKNYLFRKWGILSKDGYELTNDLSIVSYIKDK